MTGLATFTRSEYRQSMSGGKVLFISSSVGLGHAVRDLAIADELHRVNPGVSITWLAAGAARDAIADSGGILHPRVGEFAGCDEAIESAANGYTLRLDDYGARVGAAWQQHYLFFRDLMANEQWDLVIGDETYEIWFPAHDEPAALKCPFVMIYDFVALWPIGWRERLSRNHGSFSYRQATDHRLCRRTGSRVVFVGEEDDLPAGRFGFAMPRVRQYAAHHYSIVGNVFRFDPKLYRDSVAAKRRLGYGDEPLVIVTVGGTSVGRALIELSLAAYPLVQKARPGLRMIIVCGPRLAPEGLAAPEGVSVLRYVPRLYEHFAAADLVITQGGGTTTAELTALRRPFLYFPLEGHDEQRNQVAARQRRIGAGTELEFGSTGPQELARATLDHLGETVTYPDIDGGGAQRAARVIAELLAATEQRVTAWRGNGSRPRAGSARS
jgi:UDP:flavonoid glycosyltransferase YjiC (YdhE family)